MSKVNATYIPVQITMDYELGPDVWNDILSKAVVLNHMTIPKLNADGTEIPHPSESGLFRRSIGERHGQISDWRASISGSERGVHVLEYPDCYKIHVDRYDPYKKPVQHIVKDSPRTGAAIALAGIGLILAARAFSRGKKKR